MLAGKHESGGTKECNQSWHFSWKQRQRGVRYFICERGVVGQKITFYPQGREDAFGLREDWTAPFFILVAVLHFRPDLDLVKIADSTRIQVLTGAVQGTDHFFSIFCDGGSVRVTPEFEFEAQEKKESLSLVNLSKLIFANLIYAFET